MIAPNAFIMEEESVESPMDLVHLSETRVWGSSDSELNIFSPNKPSTTVMVWLTRTGNESGRWQIVGGPVAALRLGSRYRSYYRIETILQPWSLDHPASLLYRLWSQQMIVG